MNRIDAIPKIRKCLEDLAWDDISNAQRKEALHALTVIETDSNVLPELPKGWRIYELHGVPRSEPIELPSFYYANLARVGGIFGTMKKDWADGKGETPRAALLSAIAKIPAGKDGGG